MLAVASIPVLSRKRPRGLWNSKGRASTPRSPVPDHIKLVSDAHDSGSDNDEDDCCERSSTSGSSKRRRCAGHFEGDSEDDFDYWERSSPPSSSSQKDVCIAPARRTKIMDTTTTAAGGIQSSVSCDYEDWEDLKDLFARAAEQYESDDCAAALPLLRGVIHECHRFLLFYQDPSVLFAAPPLRTHSRSPDRLTPPDERLFRDWGHDRSKVGGKSSPDRPRNELPTAFHSILGIALFMFGNLIGQDPSLALGGEPGNPCTYWLAALDVFETGENLPSRTSGQSLSSGEDWRMAIFWGRTLVCLADETLTRSIKAKVGSTQSAHPPSPVQYSADEHKWPAHSPFSTIATRRPPMTRRMSLSSTTANDLMVLAMDQFARGMFHMPHPKHHRALASQTSPTAQIPSSSSSESQSFSRPKELFTIASEVLGVAERLEHPSERQYWASWADSVFNQMKMEADMDAWRGPITRARGRCWLIIGSARVDELEAALEKGLSQVLYSDEAEEARDGLATAISFFERAKGSATSSSDPETQELQPLLAEAILTLANLTVDENKREELYSRAQSEGQFHLDTRNDTSESMDETD